jgi:hypothetical protein
VKVFQTGAGRVTLDPGGTALQGPNQVPETAGVSQFGALTAIWVASESKWVVAPFSFSGSRPSGSNGGNIVDSNGRRYHVFTTPGDALFYSHKDMTVDVYLVGAGGPGADAGTQPGQGGPSGIAVQGTFTVEAMRSFRVHVGVSGETTPTSFETVTGANGSKPPPDTPVEDTLPYSVPPELIPVFTQAGQPTVVGGSGPDNSGPIAPLRIGMGGSGAFLIRATQNRPSHTEVINHPGSSGTPGGTNSMGATPYECNCRDVTINGDTMSCAAYMTHSQACGNGLCCIPSSSCTVCAGAGACPGGWWIAPGGGHCQTSQRQCDTCYSCPGGWYLSGSTCLQDYAGTPGSPGWQETVTVWDPCPANYVIGSDTTKCVDPRQPGAGLAGGGCVIVGYALA